MRVLRQFFVASVLVSMLTLSALAGEMSTTVAPPPAPTQGEMQNGVNGFMPNGDTDAATTDDVAAGVVALVQGVLSLL